MRASIQCLCVAAVVVWMTLLPGAASAQYFGPNKVQYQSLQFHVLKTQHFDIYFHQENREPIDLAGRLAERWWTRLSAFFGTAPFGRQPLVLYSSHAAFEQTLVVPGLIDSATGGLTEPARRRIVMPFAASLADTDHVLGHELVHAFQFGILAGQHADPRRGAGDLPLWFVEGLAEFLSLGGNDAHTAMWLRDAVAYDDLPSLSDLESPSYFPYRWGHGFWAYVSGRWGSRMVADLFVAGAVAGVPAALERVLGVTPEEFAAEWHAALRSAYRPAEESAQAGTVAVSSRRSGGSINVGPALSPDGRWIAFVSERSLVSMDLFVADAATGAIVARLTDTAADPHYSNLQYIGSAGAWDGSGRRLAVGTMTSGRAAITVFKWPGGTRELEALIDDVDEVYGPTWSPDGQSIAFSAMVGGVTDLFVYELEAKRLRRLTDDLFTDVQAAWQPGGQRIAFVTDRFSSDPGALIFGDYRLALIDVHSGVIEPVQAFATGKHVSPQWSPDGRRLHFISDRDGISDIYSVELESGELDRLTRATSGVSGITASSPAISVAAGDGALVFTVFQRATTAIHRLAAPCGEPADATVAPPPRLPPIEVIPYAERRWNDDPVPEPAEPLPIMRYRPRLSLDRITDASFGVGVGRFGATVGTGLGLAFSDMLNMHWLIGAVQLDQTSDIRHTAVYGAYLNQAHRWNWSLIGSSIPSYVGVRGPLGDPLLAMWFGPVELIRQTERVGTAMASYAFDRAKRVELQAGLSRLAFERFTAFGGQDHWQTAAPTMTLATTGLALVRDTTSHGAVSVLRGERYRLETTATVGTIRYLNLLADYRRYVMPAPFYTFAARALHFGRYGAGADDSRIPPLYVGYPSLVRGYDLRADVADQCLVPLPQACSSIDDMVGSRIAVGNLEFRFPLLRPFGISRTTFGSEAVEVAFFVDGGLVWRGSASGALASAGSAGSTGITLRTSLIGLGLGQFDIARPFRNPEAGWVFQFNLAPAL
jgi:hypothetical protein